MTTIAYRDGILAADTRATDSGYHPGIYRCEKLFRVGNDIVGTAGDDTPGMVFLDWYTHKDKRKPPSRLVDGEADFCCLVLSKNGLFWYDKWCRPNKVLDEFYAIGSGGAYAMGAMGMGATAEEAVRQAARWDCYTGGDIVTMALETAAALPGDGATTPGQETH
jgi:20S proteasome alpha/beta subunit